MGGKSRKGSGPSAALIKRLTGGKSNCGGGKKKPKGKGFGIVKK